MYTKNDYRDYLSHHGILGMHWGRRQGPPYPLGSGDHSASEKKAGWRKSLGGGRNEEEYGRKHKGKKSGANDGSSSSTKSVKSKSKSEKSGNEKAKKALKVAVAVGITAVAAYGVYKGAKYINAGNLKIGKKALSEVMEDTAEFTFADGSSFKTVSRGNKLVDISKPTGGIASNAGDAYEKLKYGNNSPYGVMEFKDGSKIKLLDVNGKTKAFHYGDINSQAGKEYQKMMTGMAFEPAKGSKNLLAKDPSKVRLTKHEMPSHIKDASSISDNVSKTKEAVKKVESVPKVSEKITSNKKVLDLNSPEGIAYQKKLGITPFTPSSGTKHTMTMTTEGYNYNAAIQKNADAFAKKASELTSQTSKVDAGDEYIKELLKKTKL